MVKVSGLELRQSLHSLLCSIPASPSVPCPELRGQIWDLSCLQTDSFLTEKESRQKISVGRGSGTWNTDRSLLKIEFTASQHPDYFPFHDPPDDGRVVG